MIITIEIEQMIKELSNMKHDKANGYINILNRTLLEMREQSDVLKQSMQITQDEQLQGLNLLKENIELRKEVNQLSDVINVTNETD